MISEVSIQQPSPNEWKYKRLETSFTDMSLRVCVHIGFRLAYWLPTPLLMLLGIAHLCWSLVSSYYALRFVTGIDMPQENTCGPHFHLALFTGVCSESMCVASLTSQLASLTRCCLHNSRHQASYTASWSFCAQAKRTVKVLVWCSPCPGSLSFRHVLLS